ncbi:hypothetical protein MKW94_004038 [Papaver nudicaule]|uniref:Uncharacterized protein n=1 Tax=Papaver nudicaule TaxID=74823 RepID=A0AA41UYR8_PAPNU|nr:hypothetical protein [Papaver nudicaule]
MILLSKADGIDDHRPRKIRRISYSYNITNLPGDCLNLIFKCLGNKDNRDSFGLTCRHLLHIQNNYQESLWWSYSDEAHNYPRISPDSFPNVLCKLLIRFQLLKYLSFNGRLKITDFARLQPHSFGSNVQYLCIDDCSEYSDIELSIIFSWFPRLKDLDLRFSQITDVGLEALAKCCSSLEKVNLYECHLITDSGISGCKLEPEGINAIVSCGRLKYLSLYDLAKVEEGFINSEAVMMISKGCPLLKTLNLSYCKGIELEGWEAIGRNCKNLQHLTVYGCNKFCDQGLQALRIGCNKLSKLCVDNGISCSSSAIELFKHKRPNCEVS